MVKVFNASNIGEERLKRNGYIQPVVFSGSAKQNLADTSADELFRPGAIKAKVNEYNGSESYAKICQDIEDAQKKMNAVQTPSATDVQNLLGLFIQDITRRVMETPDLTSFLATETSNPNDPESVTLQNVLPYRGIMGEVKGNGEAVNLIQPATAENKSVYHKIKAVGYETSLRQLVFDPFYTNEKVIRAAVDSDTDERNKAIVGAIVGATYKAKQKQAKVEPSGATFDVKTYETIKAAIKTLRKLKDPQNKSKIAVPSIAILCNSANTWDLERVINGQLQGSNGTVGVSNMSALPIAQIFEYDHGINDGFTIGKEVAAFPGVPENKCYMFVPRAFLYVRNKRPLTLETSRGSALTLSEEAKAWYRIQGVYLEDFLGSSFAGSTLADGYGAIVEVELPTS